MLLRADIFLGHMSMSAQFQMVEEITSIRLGSLLASAGYRQPLEGKKHRELSRDLGNSCTG
jgi:hypothetical protein